MYVIETAPSGAQTLTDITARELRESRAKWEPEGWTFREVHFTQAHAWVKKGNIHSTDLWLDQGRVRRAGGGCW